jgi:hypothetical protein
VSGWQTTAAFVAAIVLAGACSSGSDPAPEQATSVDHVHGLGVDPDDPEALFLATHLGTYRYADGEITQQGELFQDTMGFTVTPDGRMLGSGHPDLRDESIVERGDPPLLGLIESVDDGATWQPLSRQARSDFHGLQAAGDQLFGYDSTAGRFMVTTDLRRWETRSRLTLTSFAVSPDDPRHVVATDADLRVIASTDGGRTWNSVPRAPILTYLSWSEDRLGALGPEGTYWTSTDGVRFRQLGHIEGTPGALLLTDGRVYAATDVTVVQSDDGGRTFEELIALG